MSFQAYLDNIQQKTGIAPKEFILEAKKMGFDKEDIKANSILKWLKDKYNLDRGYGMAIVHIIKNGEQISSKHVMTKGKHSDPSNKLNLTGKSI